MSRRKGQSSRGRRRGEVFSVRLSDEERAEVERYQREGGGPRAIGPWLLWSAVERCRRGTTATGLVVPDLLPVQVEAQGSLPLVVPGLGSTSSTPRHGTTGAHDALSSGSTPAIGERLILDLCGGSGSWSAPYRAAGYPVQVVTLPHNDVRGYQPPPGVWGILAAPPCEVFSLARTTERTDSEWLRALEVVFACLRVVALASPRWWALENPTGHLGEWLGAPRDTFQPCDFGDPWTKRTSLWGRFNVPRRGPFVEPVGGMDARTDAPEGETIAARRAVTPPGFARAFAEANP